MTTDTIESLSEELWDEWMAAMPLVATLYGDHRFDDRLGPVTREETDAFTARVGRLAARAEALDGLTGADALTRDVLVAFAHAASDRLATGMYTAPIGPFLGVQSELPMALSRSAAAEPAHAEMLLARVRAIPEHLAELEARQREDLADGLTPTAENVARVIAQIEASVTVPLDSDPYLTIGAPPGWAGEAQWRADLTHAVEEGIRPALARYRHFLASTALPMGRSDDEAGMLHLPDGRHRYATLVTVFTSLPMTAEEVHEVGLEETAALRDELAGIGAEVFGVSDAAGVIGRLRDDPDLRYSSADEMLDHARRTIERAWEAVAPWFGAMPSEVCQVLPAPEALAPSLPGAYYGVGSPDGERPGTYFLNTHQPEARTRFDGEAVAHHEAIPGHHFDRTLAAELTDIPRFRRYATDVAHTEGWGLYAERLADEIGLYSSPVDRLGLVASDAWRAMRLVVDTGIHHYGWSRSRAIEYFAENAPVAMESIVTEVDRYIATPGQAVAYKIGQREILRLREKARSAMGDRFSYPGYHDVVLTNGSVPLAVLGRLVDDWIAGRST